MLVTTIVFSPKRKIIQFCQETIGKTPKTTEFGADDTITLVFASSLTTTEKTKLDNALPDMIKKMYIITVTEA